MYAAYSYRACFARPSLLVAQMHNTASINFLCWPTLHISSVIRKIAVLWLNYRGVSLNSSNVTGEHIIFWMNSVMFPSYTQIRTERSSLRTTGRLLISVSLGRAFLLYRSCNHWWYEMISIHLGSRDRLNFRSKWWNHYILVCCAKEVCWFPPRPRYFWSKNQRIENLLWIEVLIN